MAKIHASPSVSVQSIIPRGYWKDKLNHVKFVDELVTKVHKSQNYHRKPHEEIIPTQLDFYKLQNSDFDRNNGSYLIRLYNNSVYNLLSTLYPQHEWVPWKFSTVPRNFWKDIENQKKYFKWLEKQLGIEKMEDWYNIPVHKLQQNDVLKNGLVKGHYGDSLYLALSNIYPDYSWIPWKFQSCPRNYWKDLNNRRAYFDWLGKQLNFKNLDEWCTITLETIKQNYGGGLLQNIYKNSIYHALVEVYPEHSWQSWKFSRIPRGLWSRPEAVYQLLERVTSTLSITTLDDWYRVSVPQLKRLKCFSVVKHYGSLYRLLETFYPHHCWDESRFNNTSLRKSQRWLYVLIKKLFPNQAVLENYIHRTLTFENKRPMELDVFLPDINVAFEYQGKQHYQDIGIFGPAHSYSSRDAEKRKKCIEAGITLIEVPYSWDNTLDTLLSLIQTQSQIVASNIKLEESNGT